MEAFMAKLYVNPGNPKSKINKEIYGNFSEHLGRCIYEGLFVGEDSPIPNRVERGGCQAVSVCANRRNNGGEFVKSAVFLVGEVMGKK